jgi:D-alanine-D-alanine ligase
VRAQLAALGTPVFVKPARLGSSVGIAKAGRRPTIDAALDGAFAHDSLVIVEAFSDGIEVECSVIGLDEPEASVPGEIVLAAAEWYDYEAKYSTAGWSCACRARIPDAVAEEVRRLARETFVRVGCAGWRASTSSSRTTACSSTSSTRMPGFTATSVFPKLWEAGGLAFRSCATAAALALERFQRERAGHAF